MKCVSLWLLRIIIITLYYNFFEVLGGGYTPPAAWTVNLSYEIADESLGTIHRNEPTEIPGGTKTYTQDELNTAAEDTGIFGGANQFVSTVYFEVPGKIFGDTATADFDAVDYIIGDGIDEKTTGNLYLAEHITSEEEGYGNKWICVDEDGETLPLGKGTAFKVAFTMADDNEGTWTPRASRVGKPIKLVFSKGDEVVMISTANNPLPNLIVEE